jgi:ubiquinone/menaquinone biosynthesis C-methylase UbiE
MRSVNYNKALHKTYERGRTLASDTVTQWMSTISEYLSKPKGLQILDVGSGTGRFSLPLAEWFDAWVIGVEPSEAMRRKAKTICRKGHISYIGGKAENIPFVDSCFDAAFASMTIHHFDDIAQACWEIARVLKPNGHVFVRNSFKNRLDSVRYYDFFPSARDIDNSRLPSIEDVVNIFKVVGLTLEDHQVIKQRIDDSLTTHCERIKLKALSTFEFISEEEFQSGIRKMKEAAQNEVPPKPVFEDIDLLVFQKLTSSASIVPP